MNISNHAPVKRTYTIQQSSNCGNVWDGNAQCTCHFDGYSYTVNVSDCDSDETNYGSDTASQGFDIATNGKNDTIASHSPSTD